MDKRAGPAVTHGKILLRRANQVRRQARRKTANRDQNDVADVFRNDLLAVSIALNHIGEELPRKVRPGANRAGFFAIASPRSFGIVRVEHALDGERERVRENRVVQRRSRILRSLPGGHGQPGVFELPQRVADAVLNPVLRVFGHRPVIDEIILCIQCDAEKLVIIPAHAGVRVGRAVVLMGIALQHNLPALCHHVFQRLNKFRRARHQDGFRNALVEKAERVGVNRHHRNEEGNVFRVQIIGRLPQLFGWGGRIDIFGANNSAMTFRMRNLQDIVKHVGKNNVTIFFTQVSKGRIGHVPEVAAMNDVGDAIRRGLPAGHGRRRRQVGIQNRGPSQLGVKLVLGKRIPFVVDDFVTR